VQQKTLSHRVHSHSHTGSSFFCTTMIACSLYNQQ